MSTSAPKDKKASSASHQLLIKGQSKSEVLEYGKTNRAQAA